MKIKCSILVVDDERDVREILRDMLIFMGCDVTVATDGYEALTFLETHEFDLILSDIRMPGMSGLELLCRVKERFPFLPVVMITGFPSLDIAIDAMKQGAADFITKPFQFDRIEQALNRLMQERQLLLENAELSKELEQQKKIERLNTALSKKINELSALYSISEEIDTIDEKEDILEKIVSLVAKISESEQVSLFIVESEPQTLTLHTSSNKRGQRFGSLPPSTGEALVRRAAMERECYLGYKGEEGWCREKDFVNTMGPILSLILPIIIRGSVLGVLYISQKRGGGSYDNPDIPLLKTMVEKAALRLENHALYANLFSHITDTLRVLVSTLEARDQYTRDHSLRVVNYSLVIAEEMKLSQDERAMIEFAAYLHDIGKIGIPDQILLKPGRLTDEESTIIRMHPVIGESILQPLHLDPLERAIVRNHHERIDGQGYPDGLPGQKIPLVVRVVSVADAFDAMTSPRPYRSTLSLEYTLAELKRSAGKQLDLEVVEAFLRRVSTVWHLSLQPLLTS